MRRKKVTTAYPADWVVSEKFKWNGREIVKGTELSFHGATGRFRFIKHVKTPNAEWVDAAGGKHDLTRSFRPEKIKTVHRTKHTMTPSEAQKLVNSKNREKREAS